jgi:hypothetical protein
MSIRLLDAFGLMLSTLQFNESSSTSNRHLNLGFDILLLLCLILLAFPMLILWIVGLTERVLMVLVIFLDLFLFAGLLKNNIYLFNPSHRMSM